MKDLKAMLGKPDKNQDEDKKMAKMKALKDLKDHMSKSMGKGLMDGMEAKKVSVIAPDTEHLKEGLDTAKKLVDKEPEEGMEDAAEEASESPEEEASEESPEVVSHEEQEVLDLMETPDDVDAMIQKLEEKKKALLAQK